MPVILVTDAVGLIGRFVVDELVSNFKRSHSQDLVPLNIRAGYHSQTELDEVHKVNADPGMIEPVLLHWARECTYVESLQGANSVLLLTPFTSDKVTQIRAWIDALKKAASSNRDGKIHVVHVGVHCNDADKTDRLPHETWQLEAEAVIRESAAGWMTWTFLRINFDGYNGVIRPGEIAYFLPQEVQFGWVAREDIAAVAARALTEPDVHAGKTYTLSTELLSLDDMANVAKVVCGCDVSARSLTGDDFRALALSPQANPQDDPGYVRYIDSVSRLFEGLGKGRYRYHSQAFPYVVQQVCGREFLSFKQWLAQSPYKAKLLAKV